jgi:hypothetical protein
LNENDLRNEGERAENILHQFFTSFADPDGDLPDQREIRKYKWIEGEKGRQLLLAGG